ncbi:MAG TPA: PaaI family thioesterase [Acidimicrobiales bacterium]|nr:PaaI family thioesterase [Acidimicrobiales bacterium]
MSSTFQTMENSGTPFHRSLGLRWTMPTDRTEDVAVEMDVGEEFCGPAGSLEGGIVSTLIDVAAGSAAAFSYGRLVATQHLAISFLSPGRKGPVRATAQMLRQGKTDMVCEVRVVDLGMDSRLMAVGLVTLRALADRAASEAPGLTGEAFVEGLSAETRARALSTRHAMAAKFGVEADAVRIVPFDFGPDGTRPLVILGSGNGLKMGSWDDIAEERRQGSLAIDIDGVTVDTGEAMTWAAYQALVREAKASGMATLPDSAEVAAQGDQPWTCTLLTGEATSDGRAPFAFVNEGRPGRSWGGTDYLGGLRFRPAVVIE